MTGRIFSTLVVLSLTLFSGCLDDGPNGKEAKDPSGETPQVPGEETITLNKAELDALIARIAALESGQEAMTRSITSMDQRLRAEETATTALIDRLTVVEGHASQVPQLTDTAAEHAARLEATEVADAAAATSIKTMTVQLADLDPRVGSIEKKTAAMRVSEYEGHPAVVFTGVNLYLHNKTASPGADGTGNLILGNNDRNNQTVSRTGSYNIVSGIGHEYQGVGSLLIGSNNRAEGNTRYNVLFGAGNKTTVTSATVLGGHNNKTAATHSAILGGTYNTLTANAIETTVIGGFSNTSSTSDTIVPQQW